MRGSRRLALGGALVLLATTVACDHEPPALEGEGWVEVWEDTFDYASVSELDDEWGIGHFDVPTQAAQVQLLANPDDPQDRMVRLTASPQFNNWTWGLINTLGPRQTAEPNYPSARSWQGPLYVEAMIRYTEDAWTWPAMYLYSHRKSELATDQQCSEPVRPEELTAEWDIMENGWHGHTTSQFETVVHRNTRAGNDFWCGLDDQKPPMSSRRTVPAKEPLGGWHLWAGYWRADGQLCTYLDDELMHCYEAYDSFAQPLALHFAMARQPSLWWCSTGCPPQPSALTMDITNVRVLLPPD